MRSSYYAWEWGDALFVVIDPYWSSTVCVDEPFGGGPKRTNLWEVTHGDAQYQWLKATLEGVVEIIPVSYSKASDLLAKIKRYADLATAIREAVGASEREVFLSLCGEPKTLERIQFTLKNGKPLRNLFGIQVRQFNKKLLRKSA